MVASSSPYVVVPLRIGIEAGAEAPPWIPDLERRVNHLLALPADWDSYGAQPVRLAHVVSALQLLHALVNTDSPMPVVVPTAARGVQLEWQSDIATVEARVGDDGAYIYVGDRAGETEGIATSELASRAASALASAPLVA